MDLITFVALSVQAAEARAEAQAKSELELLARASKRSWLLEGAGYWALMQVTGSMALAPLIVAYSPVDGELPETTDTALGSTIDALGTMGTAGRIGVAGMLVAFAGSILYGVRSYASRYVDEVLVAKRDLRAFLDEGKPIRKLHLKTLTLLGQPRVAPVSVASMSVELIKGLPAHEAFVRDLVADAAAAAPAEERPRRSSRHGKRSDMKRTFTFRTADPRTPGPFVIDFDGDLFHNELAFDLLVRHKLAPPRAKPDPALYAQR
ncbi:uncharacterized protein AMSG_10211 [Thecamonas trahens ATCC 50062]|uniref:Uncharacterized protein n=1 Tax=Thecamonas trahens ATCC 50062 TaxID=461836 RepID=A0A0L0DSF6_THETB|nr:hypothetical protein AMSG_10211 [Thecamonas trahens ATCC 50062]KNC54966.1 hypothetical protein AMSG_10211 [Thecamonas trahens ATCC 50062]|eukprot:XP_013753413.1 hypothetical protein AMSG_10211 [Thecamonas trahens ATCC 50062]